MSLRGSQRGYDWSGRMTWEVWTKVLVATTMENDRRRPRTLTLMQERKYKGPFDSQEEAEREALRLSERYRQQFFVREYGDGDGGTVQESECVRHESRGGSDSTVPIASREHEERAETDDVFPYA